MTSSEPQTFPVVCIGLSSGAIAPLRTLFRGLNSATGMAFVVIHHLRSHYPTHLPEILSSCTPMQVEVVTPGMMLQPDHVYVMPSGQEITVSDGEFGVQPRTKVQGWSNVVSIFLNSLGASSHQGVAVILSGLDENGAAALKAFKEHGGITIAQALGTALHPEMPDAAIKTGAVNYVLVRKRSPGG